MAPLRLISKFASCLSSKTLLALSAGVLLSLFHSDLKAGKEEVKEKDVANIRVANGVELEVTPLENKYFDKAVVISFRYVVGRSQAAETGTVTVTMFNFDTGKEISKTIPVSLSLGEHMGEISWGGTSPDGEVKSVAAEGLKDDKDASFEDSQLDELFSSKTKKEKGKSAAKAEKEDLPDGLYVPKVAIRSAKGEVLVEYSFSPDQVKRMMITGDLSRKVSKGSVERAFADITKWYDEITQLEDKARAAGADTSIPHLMVLAMRQAVKNGRAYIDSKWYNVIFRNHTYLEANLPETRRQLEMLIKDPKSGISADIMPRPAGRMSIKDGYFYAGDKPVFMSGLCMFALWLDLPFVREMGYNLVHIGCTMEAIFPESEESIGEPRVADYNVGTKCNLVEFLDECSRLGIKVDLGLPTNGLPKWFFKRYPEAERGPNSASIAGMIPYDIENPDAQRVFERHYQIVMSKIAGHPALNSIWLANEPSYLNYGERSMALFRQSMQEKYGSVEKLNQSWGTSLKSFAAITPENFGRAITPAQTDFWWFNMGRINHHFEWLIANIRKYDKNVPVTFKLNSLQMGHHGSALNVGGWLAAYPNVDQEGVTDMSQIAGMDGGTFPFIKQYYDWLRSLSPEKPVVNLEFKGGGTRTKLDMWKGVLHGLAGIDWWCWHPKPSFTDAMCDVATLHEQALATYNIQRCINEVMAFQKFPRSPFAVLYPDPVQPRSWYYFDAHNPTVHALKLMGYAVDYITEKRLAEGRLEKYSYRILLLPAADYIKDETLKHVEAFVQAGGIAVVVGSLPEHDEMGRSRDVNWLKAPADAKPASTDMPGTVVYPYGKGKVWIIPSPRPQADEAAFYRKFVPNDQESRRNIYASLKEIAKLELPPLPIVLNGLQPERDDTELRTINWKDSSGRDCLLTYIFNERDYSGQERVTLAPQFNVKVSGGVDIITGEKIDPAKIEIPGWGVRLIKWTLEGK